MNRASNKLGFAVTPYSQALSLLDSVLEHGVLYSRDDECRLHRFRSGWPQCRLSTARTSSARTYASWLYESLGDRRLHFGMKEKRTIHSHLAFLKRKNRRRQTDAISPSTTRYP
jgi:hypothetical protein